MSRRRRACFTILTSVALLAAFLPALATRAASPIIVTTTVDEYAPATGDTGCALREAVQAANSDTAYGGCTAGSGADTIKLGAHTYTLTRYLGIITDNSYGDLNVSAALTIVGVSATATVIDGNGSDRSINNPSAPLSISRTTLQNGNTTGDGGGIYAGGTLTLSHAVVSANTSGRYGGGIAVLGANASLQRVVLVGNHAGVLGGGLPSVADPREIT